ncbi:MAG: alcohol dehydrogenase catalytic domain-containing protein [Micrococcales bacterium]|nr:alcohol dehydrogenase catalytic domain-containing protein [Micrococcales bacterium]
MTGNRVIVYKGPGQVAIETIDYPTLELPPEVVSGLGLHKSAPHAVILKLVATNICGSDQHMVRGRTTAPVGQTLGHEITGEVVEVGSDVLFVREGDICSVPFNIACGRCRMCNEGKTGICLNVNPARPGAAYGYVDMGGWIGGQAEYVMVPFADFNLLKFPDRDQALEKILDLTMLSDIFPTGYHGAYTAGVTTGSTVYVAGAGPVGLAAAFSAQLLGASAVIVGDMNADAAIDAVGFEARGHGDGALEAPATVLNDLMTLSRAGAGLGIPGLYVTGDPGGIDDAAQVGQIGVKLGLGWAKSHSFTTGQCPVKRYNRRLMNMILADKAHIAKAVNATRISLDEAPESYQAFDEGAATKYVIDPHGMVLA